MADIMTLLGGGNDDLYTEIIKENLEKRILIINDEINESILENYILYILKWNAEDADIPVNKRRDIRIYINSPGGSSIDGFNLVNVCLASKTKIKTVCFGLAASMGYHVFLSGSERIAFPDSILLQHDGEVSVCNSTSKARQTMDFFAGMEKRTKEYVLSRTTMTEEFYDKVYDQEYYMYANDEGKTFGCVHKVIGEDCDLDYIL